MKTVLITGGTSGIGLELAKIFAKEKDHLVIVSSNPENLIETKKMFNEQFNLEITTIEQDLSQLGAAEQLYQKIKQANLIIDILVNNAGIGYVGATHEISSSQDEKMITLNVINLVNLTKLFVQDFCQRKKGKILNVASTGAFQPGPYTATYFASKSFVLNYTKAVRYEVKKDNVQVSVLCPGTTKTKFFQKAGQQMPKKNMTPEKVALRAYQGLMKNKEVIIPGFINKIVQIVPTKIKMHYIAKMKKK